MEYFNSFFIENFILLCIVTVMTINCVQKFNEHKRLSIYTIVINLAIIFLAFCDTMKYFFQYGLENIPGTLTFSNLGYILRPTCILLFIFLIGKKLDKKRDYIIFFPLVYAILVYCLTYIPPLKDLVYNYHFGESGNIVFHSGHYAFRYTSHLVCAIYLIYLIILSIRSLKAKHLSHAVNIFICVIMVVVAAGIETFDYDGEIKVLNCSVAICTSFYYLYFYAERNKYDALTGLFNRAMYFADLPKFEKSITSVIQLDMNGLKYINDTYGHIEGDISLEVVSSTLLRCATRKMYVYRLGGDEFLILALNEAEDKVLNTINRIKDDLAKTDYSLAIGYSHRENRDISLDYLLKDAEKKMYIDKDEFYKTSTIKRRKVEEKPQE